MATPITGIALNCDFQGYMKLIVFCPFQGSGIDIGFSVTRNLVNIGTYNSNMFFYDSSLGAYVKWLDFNNAWGAIGGDNSTPEIDNGSITAYVVTNPSETYSVKYQYKSYGYNALWGKPQGIGVTYQPCINGMSKVFVNSEPKPNDHYSYTKTLLQTAQIISPTTGSVIVPTYVALTSVDNQLGEFNWAPSNNPNLSSFLNTKDCIWDLGNVNSSQPFTVRVVGYGTDGTDGFATGDFIEETVQVFCSLSGTNGTGTTVTQNNISNYTLPAPTTETGCLPTGLTVVSVPIGSTIKIGGVTYAVNSTIPLSALTLTGTNYTGIDEHTTTSTVPGTNTGATFVWESACGQSNEVLVIRTVVELSTCTAPAITTQPSSITACNTPSGLISVTAAGTAPLSYQWKLNGSDIPTETNSSINVSADGSYTVVVTNSCGSVTSNAATLTTNTSPSGGGSQTAINITVGTPYSKIITYSGTAPLSISAITKPSWLTITLLGNIVTISGTPGVGDVGSSDYSFIISNLCGQQITSTTGGLVTAGCTAIGAGTVNGNASVVNGVTETYTITGLTGTVPYSYTWNVTNGIIISGQGTDTVQVQISANGSVNCSVTNCSGLNSVSLSKVVTLITADAIDDVQGVKTIGTAYNVDVSTNDTVCNNGVTSYALTTGSLVNVVINSVTGSIFNYTPVGTPFSFQYEIKCNGVTLDGATVSGTAVAACTNVTGGSIVGNTNVTVDVNENYNITGLLGTAPFTYTWNVTNAVIISGQGTSAIVVKPTSGGSTVQCIVKNCSDIGSVILSKTLNTKMNCTPTLHLKPTCFTVVSMTGTLSGITEPSRIISFTSSTVTFTAAVGTQNYTFLLTDTNGVVHTVTFKNITC
jgi:hypothetical protein